MDLSKLADALKLRTTEKNRGFAWLRNADPAHLDFESLQCAWVDGESGQVVQSGSIGVANVDLVLPASSVNIDLDFDAATVTFSGKSIHLSRHGSSLGMLGPKGGKVTLAMAPDEPGAFRFDAQWSVDTFYNLFRDNPLAIETAWGGEVRFFLDKGSGDAQQLIYPLSVPPGSDGLLRRLTGTAGYALSVSLDCLAPFDAARTRFELSGKPSSLASSFARTVEGKPVTLTPVDGLGFYLGHRPDLHNEDRRCGYLAPMGRYAIGFPDGAKSGRLMCGLSTLEYVVASDGDVLELVPAQPAFARSSDGARLRAANESAPKKVLTDEYTTSWMRFVPSKASNPRRGYYGQPSASVNYDRRAALTGKQDADKVHYAAPVVSFLNALDGGESEGGGSTGFPLGLYGGVYPPTKPSRRESAAADGWPNKGVSPQVFTKAEEHALTVSRQTLLGRSRGGPTFSNYEGTALSGGRSATPQGLLVGLNAKPETKVGAAAAGPTPEAGTWEKLIIARRGDQYLSINADPKTGVVDPKLADALMQDQLFLVLNDWDRFPDIDRALSVSGFDFKVSPDDGSPDPRSMIFVFKYATSQSLADLIHATGSWRGKDDFVGDEGEVSAAQATLINALKVAEQSKGTKHDPFKHFRDVIMSEPRWTGFIAFNSLIDGRNMPPDFQMLFAGIDGALRAHHFGVDLNQISRAERSNETGGGDDVDIEKSSLFGVIHYPTKALEQGTPNWVGESDSGYSFDVEELNVVIRNSAIQQFHSEIAMTIKALFGREVTLTGHADDAIRIKGRYQKQGDVGRVIFESSKEASFRFDASGDYVRVLQRYAVTGAGLAPAGDDDGEQAREDGGVEIHSRFTLDGDLGFAPDPFGKHEGDDAPLDLFSYGREVGGEFVGLPLDGLAFDITAKLNDQGQREGPAKITPNFGNVLVRSDSAAVREDALVKGLPVKLDGLLNDTKGLNPKDLDGSVVNCHQLGGNRVSRPHYALRFDLPMGSLGALADAHAAIDAGLLLAWGPSDAVPDDDGAAVYVQLPQLSAGVKGFDLQGLLKTTFGDANLARVAYSEGATGDRRAAYVLLFNNVALSVMGIKFPPRVITDFILFSDPEAPDGGNIGWNVAATQVK